MMKETESESKVAGLIREAVALRRVPSATYRLQLNRSFGFRDAKNLIPYLYELGISDLYLSPIMQARAGSAHGYDICDHNKLNPDLGGESGWAELQAELAARGMGLVLDVVPNHMAIFDSANTWWTDVLENGRSSLYAPFFDIDWNPVKEELREKVLLPILEDQYGEVLESGKFRLAMEDGAFFIYCGDIKLPVAPRTYGRILTHRLDEVSTALGPDNEHLRELQSILTAIGYLPSRTVLDPEKLAERTREKEIIKQRIKALCESSDEIRLFIGAVVADFNGVVGHPASFDLLDGLIAEQVYRLAFWRVAAEEINYRRFFDINELAAIRMEEPEVFRAAHRMVFDLLASGAVTGLRIDHADGLWDPSAYLRQVQSGYLLRVLESRLPPDPDMARIETVLRDWFHSRCSVGPGGASAWPVYMVVEKILSAGETLPAEWTVDGTTGYDFLNAVGGIFVDTSTREAFTAIYSRFMKRDIEYGALVNSAKKMIMLVSLASEIYSLSHDLSGISERNRRYRDFTLNSITFAVREVIASLGIYRTYISGPGTVLPRDRDYIEAAVVDAKRRNPRTYRTLFDFIRNTLLLNNLDDFPEDDRDRLIRWVMKFQQITGPVMAKGVEDTAFYVFNRLISLNEVGGDPGQFGISLESFHRQNSERSGKWPYSMLTTTTHDTKQSEDVRARIHVLSEMPDEWEHQLLLWYGMNARHKTFLNGEWIPDANEEYLLYQTLLGAWPTDAADSTAKDFDEKVSRIRDRILRFMDKATKEANVHTSWVNPNAEFKAALDHFVNGVLKPGRTDEFWNVFLPFQKRIAFYGAWNSLSQLLLKLSCPGVPDIYQGAELWDLRLVDPDNRFAVDYGLRKSTLRELQKTFDRFDRARPEGDPTGLQEWTDPEGRRKLYTLWRSLHFRRAHRKLFMDGTYAPLETLGTKSGHLCSFIRNLDSDSAVVAVPRLPVGLTGGREQAPLGSDVWQDTRMLLPNARSGDRYRNIFTLEEIPVEDSGGLTGMAASAIFRSFPVALLEPSKPADS